MTRFDIVQIGDRVECLLCGKGSVVRLDKSIGLIKIRFDEGSPDSWYYMDGKIRRTHTNPSLYYLDTNSVRCKERPQPILYANRVPDDTKVICIIDTEDYRSKPYKGYFAASKKGTLRSYNPIGNTSWSIYEINDCYCHWSEITIGEDITIDGITYKEGTKITEGVKP